MKYRKSMNHNYLVAEIPGEWEGDYQLEMLTENHINGLLPVERRLSEGREELYYEISSLQPLGRLYDHKVMKQKDAEALLKGILEACSALQEYMLSEDALVLDAGNLYVEPDSLKPSLLFQPWREVPFRQQMQQLAEFLMEHVEQNDTESAMWEYRLYKLVRNDNFVLSDIEKLLEEGRYTEETEEAEEKTTPGFLNPEADEEWQEIPEWKEERREEEKDGKGKKGILFPLIMLAVGFLLAAQILPLKSAAPRLVGIGFIAAATLMILLQLIRKGKEKTEPEEISSGRKHSREKEKQEEEKEEKAIKDWDFSSAFEGMEDTRNREEDTAGEEQEEDYGRTVFIGKADENAENVLVEKTHGKRYRMESFPFTIGKVKTCVDLPLNDRSVSRIHARILMQNGRAYLQDCHSTNGTFLNGIQLEAEEEVMLEPDDEIRFGRVCFCYQ